ncbi:MAG: threonine synthase [Alcaligenaceae bacterium]|nr:threonine synthase [Alcaligenaceae bacterium]
MKYVSTRGGMAAIPFSEILLEGLARDGGLAVPESIPQVSSEMLASWRSLSYAELAAKVLGLFITDIPEQDLAQLTGAAYNTRVFNNENIVPLKPLSNGITLVGLSEGPTLAFKDMAMQFLGQLFEYVLTRKNTTLNILGATSGDTGSAAEYALRGKKGVSVFMLSPAGRMSAFQRAQMFSLQDENIHNLSVHGVFDDCQDIVKALSGDLAFKEEFHLGAVNSINWARISAQVVYYFWAWLRATSTESQQVSFAVPSGNFGNILSGHIARSMGLPIRRLVLATNENNVLEEFFRTGVYSPRSAEQTYATSSPSMDISKASNFERFVYDLVGRDAGKVKALWESLERNGSFDLSELKPLFEEKFGFVGGQSSHADRLQTIKSVYEQDNILIDPHTADGVKVARQFTEEGIPMLVLETALPAKFTETIQEAIGQPAPVPEHLQDLASLPQKVTVMDCNTEHVRSYIQEHAQL